LERLSPCACAVCRRARRTVTFDDDATSERAARRELQLYLDKVNLEPPSPRRGGKTVSDLIEEWKQTVAPNRKAAGLRAAISHIRTHIVPLVGSTPLRDLNVRAHQTFVTAVGLLVSRKKTVENVYGTLSSILAKGRKWGYAIPRVGREDLEFPVDKKPKPPAFFFDADTGARIINAAVLPFRLMLLIAALCYLRIGEVTALKLSSLDFKRKIIHVDGALDYATRNEITTKSEKSSAPIPMPDLLERELKEWLDHGHKLNPEGYLFTNSKGKPYRSENVIRYIQSNDDQTRNPASEGSSRWGSLLPSRRKQRASGPRDSDKRCYSIDATLRLENDPKQLRA
jgi:integrase